MKSLKVLVLLLFAVASAKRIAFDKCLPKWVPVVLAGTERHTNLTNLSFVNDRFKPFFIVPATTVYHVKRAVKCARRAGLKVCARSGGHSFTGRSLCNGVLIDVGALNMVRVNRRKELILGPGAVSGEWLWRVHQYRRWVPGTASPDVGAAGYILGGGRGLYEGKIGLACDLLVRVKMVDRGGYVRVASKWRNRQLFWGMCGSGGGQFGIATEFTLRTVSSQPFDNSVAFRYNWPKSKAGELIVKWLDWKEAGGRVRGTLGLGLEKGEPGIFLEGACFDVQSIRECEALLAKDDFFHVEGRNTTLVFKANDAAEMHAFTSPSGGWGRRRVTNVRESFVGHKYSEAGNGNGRLFHSPYMMNPPKTVEFWQRWAEFCAVPTGLPSIPWIVCELFHVQNAVAENVNNAFPHRSNKLLQHYIIGGGEPEEKAAAYKWMSETFAPYITGAYVNYPELQLKNYAELYYGKSLCRLRKLKRRYDPKLFFDNSQPIPPLGWRERCT